MSGIAQLRGQTSSLRNATIVRSSAGRGLTTLLGQAIIGPHDSVRRTFMMLAISVSALVPTGSPVRADDSVINESATKADSEGTRRALILCGLSGDAEHHKRFSETVTKLHGGLTDQIGFTAGEIRVLYGNEAVEGDSDVIRSAKRSTREELELTVKTLGESLRPEDALWVIVIGHAHFDGKFSWLNLPGPDIHQIDFGKLFADMTCREQVFMITTPASGIYTRALSSKGRVICTATEDDWETNETEFPHELARVLSAAPDPKEFDVDQDGALTVFDLYINLARNIAKSYLDGEFLATEHSLLEDNDDGRGTEIQIDFLTVEQGGRVRPNRSTKVTIAPTADGAFSKTIPLKLTGPVVP